MYCAVFKSLKKADHFVYLATNDTDTLPVSLKQNLAPLAFILSLTLTPDTKLANKAPEKVLKSLLEKGLFLQLPSESHLNLVSFNEKLY